MFHSSGKPKREFSASIHRTKQRKTTCSEERVLRDGEEDTGWLFFNRLTRLIMRLSAPKLSCCLCVFVFQKAEKVSGKKSKAPVQLDIGNMLAALEKKQQSQKAKQDAKPVILSGRC